MRMDCAINSLIRSANCSLPGSLRTAENYSRRLRFHIAKTITADSGIVYMISSAGKGGSLTKDKSSGNQFIRYQTAIRQYHFMETIGRDDLRFSLLSFVLHAFLDYGIPEGMKYIRYAIAEKVNIFVR